MGIFLKGTELQMDPSEDVIGVYSGFLSKGKGVYHLSLGKGKNEIIIDGTPDLNHPMTCFGRMNEDIYDKRPNIRIKNDGSLIVIRTIYPGDELITSYGDEYNWDELKQEALTELLHTILTRFPLINDIKADEKLTDFGTATRHPVRACIRDIVQSATPTNELHSATLDPSWLGIRGLATFLTSGVVY